MKWVHVLFFVLLVAWGGEAKLRLEQGHQTVKLEDALKEANKKEWSGEGFPPPFEGPPLP